MKWDSMCARSNDRWPWDPHGLTALNLPSDQRGRWLGNIGTLPAPGLKEQLGTCCKGAKGGMRLTWSLVMRQMIECPQPGRHVFLVLLILEARARTQCIVE